MKRIQAAIVAPKALLRLNYSMMLACLLLSLAQATASAQCDSCGAWVEDASYVASTDDLGGIDLEIVAYSGGDSEDSWVYSDYGSLYVPGATVSPYVDCNCSDNSGGTYSGTWDFSADGPWEDLGSKWYSDLTWTIYAPAASPSACTGDSCCSCLANNPTNWTWYEEYYTEYEEYLEIWVY
jgi:hypothetical protein